MSFETPVLEREEARSQIGEMRPRFESASVMEFHLVSSRKGKRTCHFRDPLAAGANVYSILVSQNFNESEMGLRAILEIE